MNLAAAGTLVAIGLAAMALPAFADDTIATDKGDLVIHPFHHASMLITWNGAAILVDPAPLMGGPKPADITAEYKAAGTPDLILVTTPATVPGDQGEALLAHPALADLYPPDRRSLLPERLTVCGGPSLPEAIDGLASEARRVMEGR